MSRPTLLAVDGNSLAHRAFHGYEKTGLTNSAGSPVWAVYGFMALLVGICEKVAPDGIIVGFDDNTSSIRKTKCSEYKAQRSAKSPELYDQMDSIIELLRAIGVAVLIPEGLEADDVVGSAAAACEASGWSCVIATSDRDSFNLISDTTSVLRLSTGLDNAVLYSPDTLLGKYGIRPEQYLDYAALRGDPSDNLPGVAGVGEKTAAKLLGEFGTLRAALADPQGVVRCVGKTVGAKLLSEEAAVNIARNIDIMRIVRTLPVDVESARLTVEQGVVSAVLVSYELPNLVSRTVAAFCGTRGSLSDLGNDARHAYSEDELEEKFVEAAEADLLAGGLPVPREVAAYEDLTLF